MIHNITKNSKFQDLQAVVTVSNDQQYRHIPSPGWTLGCSWAKEEIIWYMVGRKTIELGNAKYA